MIQTHNHLPSDIKAKGKKQDKRIRYPYLRSRHNIRKERFRKHRQNPPLKPKLPPHLFRTGLTTPTDDSDSPSTNLSLITVPRVR